MAAAFDPSCLDYDTGRDLEGFIWGVEWQNLYPGATIVDEMKVVPADRSLRVPEAPLRGLLGRRFGPVRVDRPDR